MKDYNYDLIKEVWSVSYKNLNAHYNQLENQYKPLGTSIASGFAT